MTNNTTATISMTTKIATLNIPNPADVLDMNTPSVVRNGKRVCDELTDLGYTIADRIELWLESHPGLHSPSRIARGVKVDNTNAVAYVLQWMDSHIYVVADGNGCWRKYGAR